MKSIKPTRQLKQQARRPEIAEIDKAMKALKTLKNQASPEGPVRTAVGNKTIVVQIGLDKRSFIVEKSPAGSSQQLQRINIRRNLESMSTQYVDQSIIDTQRAARTLYSQPSREVEAIYKRLAGIKNDKGNLY